MRRLAEIETGVFVATSDMYVTSSIVVAGRDGGCLVIDPAVTVQDLDGLVADLRDMGLRPVAGFATHPHWDHVLWCGGLGDVPRFASQRAAAVAERERDGLIEGVQAAAPGHDLDLFGLLVAIDPGQERIEWEGPGAVVVTHDGHAPGHSAVFLPHAGVLIAGDMCSEIEIPLLDLDQGDPIGDYRAGLDRLGSLPVRLVIPGHGRIGDGSEFRRRIAADTAYLEALEAGALADDPRLETTWLRAEHVRQAAKLQ